MLNETFIDHSKKFMGMFERLDDGIDDDDTNPMGNQ